MSKSVYPQPMRLRSSQFVFLLLLVCSVQIRDGYASQLMAGAISGRSAFAVQRSEAAAATAGPSDRLNLHRARPVVATRLDPAARAAHRTTWPMPQPALQAAAAATRTSLLRA